MVIATIAGVGLTVLVGTGLMGLVFLSNRTGHDEDADAAEAETMTETRAEPILRVVPRPGDINANGHIFGGWVLSQMDIAAGIVASREADGPVATVAIDAMEFIEPILLHDLISVYARIERIGRTSIAIRIEVVASRDRGRREVKVTEALFTFVALDENHRPRPVKRELRRSSWSCRRPRYQPPPWSMHHSVVLSSNVQ